VSTRLTVAETIAAKKATGEGALIGYLPIGFPTLEDSIDAAVALVEEGVDILELGVPYSDPIMDGPVIQAATSKALEGGFRLSHVFQAVSAVTSRVDAPVLVMTYWNPVIQYGLDRFAKDLKEAGGAGLITPDLIPDEGAEWLEVSDRWGLERVFLAAPSSSDTRLDTVTSLSRGFVYTVSTMGITGTRDDVDQAAKTLVARLREHGCDSACVGIGISHPDHVAQVLSYADGAIVGSALVTALADGGIPALRELAGKLSKATEVPTR
jgi:tryptophan synthase alpha chain